MKKIVGFAGVGLGGLNVLFSILALALNAWVESSNKGVYASYGLWKFCYQTQCTMLLDVPDTIQAVRAFVFLGFFAMLGAAVTAGLRVFIMKDKQIIFHATVGLSIAAGFCLLIGFAIFAHENRQVIALIGTNYGGGFALCVVAWLFSWIQAGLFVVHGRLPDAT